MKMIFGTRVVNQLLSVIETIRKIDNSDFVPVDLELPKITSLVTESCSAFLFFFKVAEVSIITNNQKNH